MHAPVTADEIGMFFWHNGDVVYDLTFADNATASAIRSSVEHLKLKAWVTPAHIEKFVSLACERAGVRID